MRAGTTRVMIYLGTVLPYSARHYDRRVFGGLGGTGPGAADMAADLWIVSA